MMNLCGLSLGLLTTAAIGLVGCSNSENASGPAESHSVEATEVDLSHGGWWCVEHGVPEAECAQCDKSLAAKFQDEGDWCEEHNRPESHCFICSPERFDKYAARYEAKTGHRPPQPEE